LKSANTLLFDDRRLVTRTCGLPRVSTRCCRCPGSWLGSVEKLSQHLPIPLHRSIRLATDCTVETTMRRYILAFAAVLGTKHCTWQLQLYPCHQHI